MIKIWSTEWTQKNCISTPVAMYVWNLDSVDQSSPASFWPPFYSFVIKEYKLGICGNSPTFKAKECCYNSLDLSRDGSNGVQSGSHHQLQEDFPSNAPISANGALFCHLRDINMNWTDFYVKQDSSCVNNRYKCSKTGLFSIYPQDSCQGQPETLFLSEWKKFNTSIGKVDAEFTTFSGGQIMSTWNAYTPSGYLIPEFNSYFEYLATTMFAFACIGNVLVVLYYARKYYSRRTRYMLLFLLSQVLWLCWVVLKSAYYFTIFSDILAFSIYSEVLGILFNLATLSTVLHSAHFLNAFYSVKKGWKILNYAVLLCMHFVLAGEFYLDYFRFLGNWQQEMKNWRVISPLWVLFMFLYDSLPFMAAASELLKGIDSGGAKGPFQRFKTLVKYDISIFWMLLLQIVVMVSYIFIDVVKEATSFFGDDRIWLSMDGFLCFLLVLHGAINCLYIEKISIIASINVRSS